MTETDLERAEELIKSFLDIFVRSFGEEAVVPNMHMMLHIPDDIRRFGPSPNNWSVLPMCYVISLTFYNVVKVRIETMY